MPETRRSWSALVILAAVSLGGVFSAANDGEDADPQAQKKQDPAAAGTPWTTVILVTNAEQEKYPANDPVLSYDGRRRAYGLRETLRHVPLTAIYVSEFRASRETVAPLSIARQIEPVQIGGPDIDQLIEAIKSKHAGQSVLVAQPPRGLTAVLRRLGVTESDISQIPQSSADDLVIVTLHEDDAHAVRLHYQAMPTRR